MRINRGAYRKEAALPEISGKEYPITEYGAVSNGRLSNTEAFRKAIAAASAAGGGTVVVPPGIWLTGPIELKSNVCLHACRGAVVLFDKNAEEYPVFLADYEGQPRIRTVSPIYAREATDIAITGEGIFDGNGQLWRPLKQMKVTAAQWADCLKKSPYVVPGKESGIWMPTESIYRGAVEGEPDVLEPGADVEEALRRAAECYDYYRPVLVSLVKCDRVLIEGVTLQNSPAWNVHPLFCTNVTIRRAVIRNPYYAQNGDGLDLESCRFVHIHDVQFDVGDDAICMKSGKNAVARKIPVPTEDVWIHDCVVYHGHGGFVVGSEMSRGVRNITVENCTFVGTDVGIRFKSAIGRGGVVEDIEIRDIYMTNIVHEAVIFTFGYVLNKSDGSDETTPAAIAEEDLPEFRNICMHNINCLGADCAMKIEGLAQRPIHDILLEDSYFRAKKGFVESYAENIVRRNVTCEIADA